ncbi:MAG: DEAD/DEAH box helicase family protein [Deltaproteobacteria bacterium]|nr:DEAD/DEAH box helicase family protein [Deltaproteobacteria bacterium]
MGTNQQYSTITDYHAKLYAYELSRRHASSDIEKFVPTLMGARVDLNPHQIDAALFAFRSPLSKGAILADEVGLGKTIEAGIVLAQKWAERKRAILIIAPASLRTQWQQELWDKFSLPAVVLDKKLFDAVQFAGHSNPFQSEKIVIASYAFARKRADLLRIIDWELVVVDEAHRLRNVYKKGSSIAKDLQHALDHAPKLLLTATPLQNSLMELYGLVSFIDPHVFSDIKTFRTRYAQLGEDGFADLKHRLAPLCKRTLRRQVLEYVRYTERRPHTQDFTPTEQEEDLYRRVSEYLQRDKLWTLPSGQRALMILVLRKMLASSSFAIAGALKTMLQRLDFILHHYAEWKNGEEPETTAPLLDDFESATMLAEEEMALYGSPGVTVPFPEEQEEIRQEITLLQGLLFRAEGITNNAKGEALLHALGTGFSMMEELGGAPKAVIFTESKRTQNYLYDLLCKHGYAGQTLLFNGSNNDKRANAIYQQWRERHQGTERVTGSKDIDVRSALVEEFRDRAQIMIATEAASEGINLQFCSLVINYDLPWNPQRIEQRIGRCHRYGQKHDVVVVNFLNRNNAADKRVFELLSEKFQLFNGVFGASDEVLGSIESGVDFEKRIAEIYQNCRTPEEIQQGFDDLQGSLSEEIEEGLSVARKKLLENFDTEVAEKLHVYKAEISASVDRQSSLLWELTKHLLVRKKTDALVPDVFVNDATLCINLPHPPATWMSADILPGVYSLKADALGDHLYHPETPLAKWAISTACSLETPAAELVFNLTDSGKHINILQGLVGQSGIVAVKRLTLNALQSEDYFLLAGLTDSGEAPNMELDAEQARRLFDLPATQGTVPSGGNQPYSALEPQLEAQRKKILNDVAARDAAFFEEEMDKLDRWAEDRKKQLELEIGEMDRAIKEHKAEARKIATLEGKVNLQRTIKTLEAKRLDMRKRLFEAQDQVDGQKDTLLNDIEARMRQQIEEKELFSIRWTIV